MIGYGVNIKKDPHVLAANKFSSLPRKYVVVSGRKVHQSNNSFTPDEFLIKLEHHLSHDLWDFRNFFRESLLAIIKSNFTKTAVSAQDNLHDDQKQPLRVFSGRSCS